MRPGLRWLDSSFGMTLVELMVAIGITSILMALSMSIFMSQYSSYHKRKDVMQIQETAPPALEIVKQDLMQAGWSVKPQMAFFFEDGGDDAATGTDKIYVNDSGMFDIRQHRILLAISNFLSDALGGVVISGNVNGFTVSSTKTVLTADNFTSNMYVITDEITDNSKKVARISNVSGSSVSLSSTVSGEFVAPAIHYSIGSDADGRISLYRLDRITGGTPQPLAGNVVDLQVAYNYNGAWYCDAADTSDPCTPAGFDPTKVGEIKITLVTRGEHRDPSLANDWQYCRPGIGNPKFPQYDGNRNAPALNSAECGYIYRVYTFNALPRNIASYLQIKW